PHGILANSATARRRLLGAVVVGLLGVCLVQTWVQVGYWRNGVVLWQHALDAVGETAVAHDCLGTALATRGETEAARRHFVRALAQAGLGRGREKQGRLAEARQEFATAVELVPAFAEAHADLAALLETEGRLPEALAHYEAAAQLKPGEALLRDHLGRVLKRLG